MVIRNTIVIFLLSFLFVAKIDAQSVALSTFNSGGGHFALGKYQMDWSIGEGASVETLQGGNTLITSGVLQPFTGMIPNTNHRTNVWLPSEIALFPMPTRRMLEVDIKIAASGRLTMTLLNLQGKPIMTKTVEYFQTNQIQHLDLGNLTPGIYLLNVTLDKTILSPMLRTGSFKIEKL